MQLEVVNIEDVYPDENNPRKKFEGIDELAESFDLKKERPGEPFTYAARDRAKEAIDNA